MARTRDNGFSVIEIVLVLVVISLIGFVGWKAWEAFGNQPATTSDQATKQSKTISSTDADIKSEADLNKADETLNTTNIEGAESAELDAQTKL